MIFRKNIERFSQGHAKPTHRSTPDKFRVFGAWVDPGRGTTLVVCMKHQIRSRIVQVAGVSEKLLRGFIIRVSAVIKDLAVTNKESHGHEYTITPELPFPTFGVRMPEAPITGAWIGIESFSNLLGRQFVLR